MTALGAANVAFPSFRNSLIGMTSDYATRVNLDTDTIWAIFNDDGTATVDETVIFASTLTTSMNPVHGSRVALGSTTVGTTDTTGTCGFFDAADITFSALGGATSERLMLGKDQGAVVTATSPMLYYFGTATGLPLTPNSADVTVVWNASGIARH